LSAHFFQTIFALHCWGQEVPRNAHLSTCTDFRLMCLISHLDANADGDENKPETVTPHEDWEIMSPPLDRQTSDVSLLEKKKKSRIRVGMGEFNAV
jgi:hypothetical protein